MTDAPPKAIAAATAAVLVRERHIYYGDRRAENAKVAVEAAAPLIAAAERERIRQLAIQHGATYTERDPCKCQDPNCGVIRRAHAPFADLLTEGEPDGS